METARESVKRHKLSPKQEELIMGMRDGLFVFHTPRFGLNVPHERFYVYGTRELVTASARALINRGLATVRGQRLTLTEEGLRYDG